MSEKGIFYKIIDSYDSSNAKFEILQYRGEKSSSHLKQVRITLNNGTIVTETGALQLTQGHISSEPNPNGEETLFSRFTQSMYNRFYQLRPTYRGCGEIYLEPSSHHYILHKIEDEELIVDYGMFYCCESSVKVSSFRTKKNDSTYHTKTKLSGRGICVLQSPVPESQILKFELYNERLQICPNCVILRSRTLESPLSNFKKMFQSFIGKKNNTEIFSGTGQIWVVPTFFRNRLA